MKPLEMKVLLTGATGGIGRELAAQLVASGASVLLAGRDGKRLEALRRQLPTANAGVAIHVSDIATSSGRASLAAAAREFHDGINVLINNAGINRFGRLADQNAENIESIMQTNAVSPMLLTRALLPLLRERPGAVILNVGSIVGSIGMPGQAAYCGSKFALHGFSEALRRELADEAIRVVYVAPRSTNTAMNDAMQRFVNERSGSRTDSARAVAAEILRALAAGRRERFLGWPERVFVKVNGLLPALVDRALRRQNALIDEAARLPANRPQFDGVNQ